MSRPLGLGLATATYAGGEVVARGIWFALVLALGCLLPQREFGAWSLLMALAGLLEISLTLGLHGPAVRWLYDRDEASYRRVLFTLATLWLVGSSALFAVLDQLGQHGFHHIVGVVPWESSGRMALGVAWLGACSAIPLAALSAQRQARRYAALRVLTIAGPALGVLGFLILGRKDADGVLVGQLAGGAIPALAALLLLLVASRPPLAWRELGGLLRFALPVLPHMMAQWVLSWSDRWLLERLVDLEAVAIYHLAYLPGLGVLMLGGALNRAWYPLLYRDLEALDQAEAQPGQPAFTSQACRQPAPRSDGGREAWQRLRTQAAAFTAAMATLGAGVALWAGEALRLLPAQGYDDSPGLVAFVVAGTSAALLYLLPHNLLYHHRRIGSIPWMTGAAACLNVGLNLALIPALGPLGAAVATLLAYTALAAMFWGQAHRVARPLLNLGGLLRAAGPGLAALVVAMLLGVAELAWPLRVGAELACTAGLGWAMHRSGALAALLALHGAR